MTDGQGRLLLEYSSVAHEKEYRHFEEVYQRLGAGRKMYLQRLIDTVIVMTAIWKWNSRFLEKNTGVLLIHELPDTVKKKETEAQAYAAVWDLMARLEKNLPMAFVFYGQDTLMENNKTYDEIGIFLPNSHFLKNLERHVAKAEAILYG